MRGKTALYHIRHIPAKELTGLDVCILYIPLSVYRVNYPYAGWIEGISYGTVWSVVPEDAPIKPIQSVATVAKRRVNNKYGL